MAAPRKPKRPTPFGAILLSHLKQHRPKKLSGRQFSVLVSQPNSMISRIIYGERRPNPDLLPHWAKVLRLDEQQAAAFIEAGRSARAKGKADSTDYISELEERIAFLERFALLVGRKAIERGAQLSEESLEFLDSLEK